MALDNQQRHSMHTGFPFQPPSSLGTQVQFTNPWTSGPTAQHLMASSIPEIRGLGSMVKPEMRTSVSAPYQNGIPTTSEIPTSNPGRHITSNMLSSHPNDFLKSEMLNFGNSNSFAGDMIEAPRPRQNSLMEWTTSSTARPIVQPPRSTNNQFSDTLDSARGMVAMSQAPRQHRQRADGFYPGHSTNSSISSTASYNGYYGGGSVDSSATDYSDPAGFTTEGSRPSLPRPSGIQSVPVQGALMTTFSSKITSSTQKKHKCKVCDKRFTRPSSLQTHTYSHTGEKPFACEVDGCGRKFSVVSNLRRHKKVHSGKNQ
ncbi:uncharacterized protein H6S33_001132 [Morchella sextelata]|uniref:uncharacterized protein n=1 Tax=Morchella sextelata TaxID=1174677 RepID=UPI001D039D35|nr:uncharacterized protein H6S33_001132 [Morchella sextelata]KAH0608904.1 hypothetical protein H6S33_001132 [Morchella sextelata]